MKKQLLVLSALCLAWSAFNTSALQFDLNYEFSKSGTQPSGTPPWATVVLTQQGVGVLATLNVLDPSIGKVSEWALNFDPSRKSWETLTVAAFDASAVGSWTVLLGQNSFSPANSGDFDIHVELPTSGNVLKGGESVSFLFTLQGSAIGSLTPADFDFYSENPGGNGSYPSIIHAQAIEPTGGSAWIGGAGTSVPDGGTTLSLLGLGLLTVGVLRSRFSRQ